jgi:hypothetical protein
MAAQLVQIYYDDAQLAQLYGFAVPYKNELDLFFENSVIAKVVPATKADKIGVCSWKLREKQRYYIGRPRPITEEVINGDYDVLSFTKNTKYHKMIANAEMNHVHFNPCFDKILLQIGKTRSLEVKDAIYQNHFMARKEIYQAYVDRWLIPAMEQIENDPVIHEMAMRDSNYSQLSQQSAQHLKDKIGIGYYPMIPFLLERLFSVFCQHERIKVTYND